jgi:amino acid permease
MVAETKDGITVLAGFNTLINVLMGTGPILLPPNIANAGFAFSTIVILIMAVFSIISASYMIEMLGICNCIKFCDKNKNEENLENKLINRDSSS